VPEVFGYRPIDKDGNVGRPDVVQQYRWRVGQVQIPDKINPTAKFTLDLNFYRGFAVGGGPQAIIGTGPTTNPLPLNRDALLLQILCSYRTLVSQELRRETFKFYAVPDRETNFHWFPMGYGLFWSPTNMPNLPKTE
jgi:hypothetical protein